MQRPRCPDCGMLVLEIDWTPEETERFLRPDALIPMRIGGQRLYLKPCGHEIVIYTTEIHRGITQIVTAQGATWDG